MVLFSILSILSSIHSNSGPRELSLRSLRISTFTALAAALRAPITANQSSWVLGGRGGHSSEVEVSLTGVGSAFSFESIRLYFMRHRRDSPVGLLRALDPSVKSKTLVSVTRSGENETRLEGNAA